MVIVFFRELEVAYLTVGIFVKIWNILKCIYIYIITGFIGDANIALSQIVTAN